MSIQTILKKLDIEMFRSKFRFKKKNIRNHTVKKCCL